MRAVLSLQSNFKTLAQVSGLNLRTFSLSFLTFLEEEGPRPPRSVLDAIFNDDIWGPFPSALLGGQTCDAALPSINKQIINCVNPS